MEAVMKLQKITLLPEEKEKLLKLCRSRTHPLRLIQRAQILLNFAEGQKIKAVAKVAKVSRPTVYKCIKKALDSYIKLERDYVTNIK